MTHLILASVYCFVLKSRKFACKKLKFASYLVGIVFINVYFYEKNNTKHY